MITDQKIDDTIHEVRRLSGKQGWPRELEGQLELVRVGRENAESGDHLKRVVTMISEHWEKCPDARKFKIALAAPDLTGVIACESEPQYPRKLM